MGPRSPVEPLVLLGVVVEAPFATHPLDDVEAAPVVMMGTVRKPTPTMPAAKSHLAPSPARGSNAAAAWAAVA